MLIQATDSPVTGATPAEDDSLPVYFLAAAIAGASDIPEVFEMDELQ
jgi:hypothetical protein